MDFNTYNKRYIDIAYYVYSIMYIIHKSQGEFECTTRNRAESESKTNLSWLTCKT